MSEVVYTTVFLLQVVLCNEPVEMFDYICEDQLTTDVGGQLEFDANEWTQHKSVRTSTTFIQRLYSYEWIYMEGQGVHLDHHQPQPPR